jgi:hypothetical protein
MEVWGHEFAFFSGSAAQNLCVTLRVASGAKALPSRDWMRELRGADVPALLLQN